MQQIYVGRISKSVPRTGRTWKSVLQYSRVIRIYVVTALLALTTAPLALADSLQVDIGHASTGSSVNQVQSGFLDFTAANQNGQVMGRATKSFSKSFPSSLGTSGNVTVSLEAAHPASTTLAFRDRGDMRGELGDLAEDFVFNEAQLTLRITGLKPGVYAMTTWHHDPRYVGGMIDIKIGDRVVIGALIQTTGFTGKIASAAFPIEANGADPVTIEIVSQSRDDKFVAYLNGFSLAPLAPIAAFDVDCPPRPVTQAVDGADGGPFASLVSAANDPADSVSATDRGMTITLAGAMQSDFHDQAGEDLGGHARGKLLRDFVRFDSAASDHPSGNLKVDIKGLKPNATYLLTWYAYDKGLEVGRPMFVYQDRIADETLLFTNAETFLYTKENKLRRDPSPDDAANTFLATADENGEIRLTAGRGTTVGSDETKDSASITVLNGLTIGLVEGLPKRWLTDFASRPKLGGRTAANAAGDSLAKDYTTEVELIPPTEPKDAEATFEVEPGFRIELVAAEPLVMDPVGMSFDERGRLFVAEMRGYNQGNRVPCADARKLALETEKLGCVKLLEDTNGDGRFDKSTVYVDNLIWPNGIFAYDGGVFVAAAPDLLYCKDTDNDGRADIRKVVLTGFGYSNWQHLPNSFRWGLDNRIHGASASGGGEISCPERPGTKPVLIRGRDFAFDPRTLASEATNSSAQFGLSFDDWGNKFLTSNSDHILLVYFEDRYIARNRMLAAPRSWRLIAASGRGADVFRISPPEPHRVVWMRMRASGVIKGIIERDGAPTGYVTAAGGTTIYRGDAWPEEFRGNSFAPECSGNLILRNVLEADGVGQIARRVDEGREFLASRDIWFRPVNMLNGPDGNMYIADMYRQVINEGVVLPPTLRRCFDLTEGRDRGRIYRVVPDAFHQPAIPDLGKASTAELVALLEHANAWHYSSAARLLYERQDPSVIEPLQRLAAESSAPLGRMHAMYALDGLSALSPDVILPRLADSHPRVREHAVRLSEKVPDDSTVVRERLFEMTSDADIRVRYQLAFTLGEIPGPKATEALTAIATRDAEDSWFRLAVLSSSSGRAGDLFAKLVDQPEFRANAGGRQLLQQLAEQAGLHNDSGQIDKVVKSLEDFTMDETATVHAVVQGLIQGLDKVDSPLRSGLVTRSDSILSRSLTAMVDAAKRRALDANSPVDRRVAAIGSLTLGSYSQVARTLGELIDSRQPQAVAIAAMETLGRFPDRDVAHTIVDAWLGLTPRLRGTATEALFARSDRLSILLDAVEDEAIRESQLDPARIQFLLKHRDQQIRERASRLFSQQNATGRDKAITAYRGVLKMAGDISKGKTIFKKVCAQCHRLEGVGHDLGLPLATVKSKGKEGILQHILAPNSNINPQYVNYVVVTDAGRAITGMIAAETANSITLKRAEGESDTVLRDQIDELVDTGMSIMPEGLEKQLSKQDIADLLAYLMSIE